MCSDVPLELVLLANIMNECGGPPFVTTPGTQLLACGDPKLNENGTMLARLTFLASPTSDVSCTMKSESPALAGVEGAELLFSPSDSAGTRVHGT